MRSSRLVYRVELPSRGLDNFLAHDPSEYRRHWAEDSRRARGELADHLRMASVALSSLRATRAISSFE